MKKLIKHVENFGNLIKDVVYAWYGDKGALLAAGISYYMLFSFVPMFLLLLELSRKLIKPENLELKGKLMEQIRGLVGEKAAETFIFILENVRTDNSGFLAMFFGILVLTFGASHLFVQTKNSLKIIWKEEIDETLDFLQNVWGRVKSLFVVLGVSVFIFAYLAASSFQALAKDGLKNVLPDPIFVIFLDVLNIVFLFGIVSLLFLTLYKYLPGVELTTTDVLGGAILAAALFTFGRWVLEYVLMHTRYGSVSGVAGSVLYVLLWFYYSAQVFLLGAEYSKAYTNRFGSRS